MATYKVLQDIEAEDKLIGPLTLRQCIYAAVALVAGWLSFLFISKGHGFLAVPLLPFIGFGVFFAFPWNRQQSTEVWALAKIRFMLKPRKRIWDQSGVKQLVTVTAPKSAQDPRSMRHLSENEVRSRLKALADTIDSRGWAVKNAPIDLYSQPGNFQYSDRLIEAGSLPQEVSPLAVNDMQDMFDAYDSPVARDLDAKISATAATRHQQMMAMAASPAQQLPAQPQGQALWYGASNAQSPPSQNPAPAVYSAADGQITTTGQATYQDQAMQLAIPVAATPTPQEEAYIQALKNNPSQPQLSYGHLRVVQPLNAQASSVVAATPPQTRPAPASAAPQNAPQSVTPPVNPAILELANNNDLNVATIAREAHHLNPEINDEVVISLH